MVLWAAVAVAILGIRPALGASYTTDTSFQFPGQFWSNTGAGLAVNAADTRLYIIKRSSTTGGVQVLDTANNSLVGSVTPPSPTLLYDVAVTPDGSTIYFSRSNADQTAYEIDAAPASDGDHAAAEVTTVIPDLAYRPSAITLIGSGGTLYMGIATDRFFYVYKASGGAWTKQGEADLGSTNLVRDVAALDTGTGPTFYVLRPSIVDAINRSPNVRAFGPDAVEKSIGFGGLPSGFTDYTFDSITAAPSVDGAPALFVAADTVGSDFATHLTVFRYTATGAYTGEGFGYQLSADAPLSTLAPLGTDPIVAPGAVSGNHFYLGGIIPDRFNGSEQVVRVGIGASTTQPGTIGGTVTADGKPTAAAHVVVEGLSTPTATTAADGTYTVGPLNPASYRIGAWKLGYASTSTSTSLASAEDKKGVDLALSVPVPVFTLAPAFVPPILDGWTFRGEYPSDPMPFYQLGGNAMDDATATTAYATYDAGNLHVAVLGGEPSLSLNSAQSNNANMLTVDDNVQIYVDPPHRHDVPAETSRLFQFAVNIPPALGGVPVGTPSLIQRRIDATGLGVGTVDPTGWTATVGYTPAGWIVEARIALTALGITETPAPDTVWGMLVGRNRPSQHNDNRPNQFSTSPVQETRLTIPNTWTDVVFGKTVTTMKGDVNHNGVVDVNDAIYVLRMAGGLSFGSDVNTSYWQSILDAADVWPAGAPDSRITLEDAVRLVRAAAGNDTLQ